MCPSGSEELVFDENDEENDQMFPADEEDNAFAQSDGDEDASDDGEEQTSDSRKVKSIIFPLYKLGVISNAKIEEPLSDWLPGGMMQQEVDLCHHDPSSQTSNSITSSVGSCESILQGNSHGKKHNKDFTQGKGMSSRKSKMSLTDEQIDALANDSSFYCHLLPSRSGTVIKKTVVPEHQ